MNSSHSNSIEQPFADWLSKAKRTFVGATIHNSGQFAVAVMNHVDVFCFNDFFDAAEFSAKDSKYRLYDLSEEPVHKMKPCRTIPDAYDPEEARRERRANRAALQQGIA
jgi:hypothetical protein